MKKTIFIATLEGVEAKNILRTSVLPTLLADVDVSIVLLMKSADRVELYKKEFSNPRILYEVIPRLPLCKADKLFSTLKFLALRTDTTKFRQRLILKENKNYVLFVLHEITNWMFSRKIFTRLLRWTDFQFVENTEYQELFNKYRPNLVFLAHLFDEPEINLLREAKKRGIKTVGLINSWDKVTTRSIVRLHPDKFIVFNEIVKEELIHYDGARKENIFVSGLPQYDFYFNKEISSREEFLRSIGVSSQKKLIVYAPLGSSFGESDWDMIDLFQSYLEKNIFGSDVAMLVRFQPNDFINPSELQKRPWLIYDYPGVRFSAMRGVDWDMDFKTLSHLKDTLTHMSLLVCFASSLSIDATVFDKPIINIGFELKPQTPTKSATQYFEREHYKKALVTGGIRLVKSKEELVVWVKAYLENQMLDQEGRSRLVQEQCSFTDGKAGERVGKFILDFLS